MQQSDITDSNYQYYQSSHFQNPNPSSNPNFLHLNSMPNPNTNASAPPVSSSYSSDDYSNYYSSEYPSYSANSDHVPNPPPTAPTFTQNPNSQPPNPSLQNFPSYDQNHPPLNYDPSNFSHNFNSNSLYSDNSYSASYGNPSNPIPPNSEYLNDKNAQFDHQGGYFDENSGKFVAMYDGNGFCDDVMGGGVYGPGGAGSESSSRLEFDDYGRPISVLGLKDQVGSGPLGKIVKAIPKMETEEDAKSGVQKFRVKVLAEGGGQSDMDVLFQIGLDGIRLLDPATSRILRIYPLEMLTRWEVLDASIFVLWAKSSIDIEPRCVRLQSNSYTTNAILDMVTASTVQLKEMGGSNPSNSDKISDQLVDKKKSFADWMNLIKPGNEEKYHWVPDESANECSACGTTFGAFVRKHHCRNCGNIFCDKCTQGRIALTVDDLAVRVCDQCMAEVTQRLSYAREASEKNPEIPSHKDLAKKLQEEMGRNRKTSGLNPDGSGLQTREVACPICTVHLQVQVPTSGSETIECSVCQHPFLVTA